MATLEVPLGDGRFTIIDAADRDLVAGFRWRALDTADRHYAHTWHNQLHLYMHRLVVGAGAEMTVDHVNGDGLDNRRLNLRLATRSQNSANAGPNRRQAGKSSRYKGVSWNKSRSRWVAFINHHGKGHHVGQSLDEDEAARMYDVAAEAVWGEFARLNFP
jgi:hypothetical protein